MLFSFEFLAVDPFHTVIKQLLFLLSRIVDNLVLFDARLAQTLAVCCASTGSVTEDAKLSARNSGLQYFHEILTWSRPGFFHAQRP